MLKQHLNALFEKEMTRKEFLATVGLGLASVMGFSSVIKMLSGTQKESKSGYGSSSYGHH